MPVFFQQQINETTRLGVWKIEETEEFFKGNVPVHRNVTHPHKRLQHLAGRFLLQFLFPDFPYKLIQVADTRKPFLKDEQYHFSISHCGDYAAAIVSRDKRVGIDVEMIDDKIICVRDKFLSEYEQEIFLGGAIMPDPAMLTLLWSSKESVFKWYGEGGVDFKKHIQLFSLNTERNTIDCFFSKNGTELILYNQFFDDLALSWVMS